MEVDEYFGIFGEVFMDLFQFFLQKIVDSFNFEFFVVDFFVNQIYFDDCIFYVQVFYFFYINWNGFGIWYFIFID